MEKQSSPEESNFLQIAQADIDKTRTKNISLLFFLLHLLLMEEFVLEEVYDFVWLSIISFKIVSLFILMLALNFCSHSYQVYDMNYIIKLIQIQQKKLSIDCQLVFRKHQ